MLMLVTLLGLAVGGVRRGHREGDDLLTVGAAYLAVAVVVAWTATAIR